MPDLTTAPHPVVGPDLTQQTREQVGRAVALVAADPTARPLVDTTHEVDPEGALGTWLYGTWWCGGPDRTAGHERETWTTHLVGALEESRRLVAEVSRGWLVLARTPLDLVVARTRGAGTAAAGDAQVVTAVTAAAPLPPGPLTVPVDAVVGSSRPGTDPRPGDLVDVLLGSSGVQADTGWWWAHTSLEPLPPGDEVDRLYVHATVGSAPAVVSAALGWAADAGVDLSLKCPSEAGGFGRRDAVVLYHRREDHVRLEAHRPRLLDRLDGLLRPGIPPMTAPVADGVGRAQDPGGGISYGQLRCAQVAFAVAEALRASARSDGPALDRAVDRALDLLVGVGVDLASPHVVDRATGPTTPGVAA